MPVITPRDAAARLRDGIDAGAAAGLLFGGERAGLQADDIALCQAIVTIPVDARFHSLNLAQAVAINAYEWRLAENAAPSEKFVGLEPPADQAQVIGFYDQLEAELDAAGFFHPPEKRPSMVRNLRVMFGPRRPVAAGGEDHARRG